MSFEEHIADTEKNEQAGRDLVPGPSGDLCRNTGADFVSESWLLDDLYCDSLARDTEAFSTQIFPEDRKIFLSWAVGILSASPSARRMIFEAAEQDWSLALEQLDGPDFHLDVPEKLIVLNSNGLLFSAFKRSAHFSYPVLVSLTRALRDVWQEKRHGAFDEIYAAEDVLMLERMRAADLDVIATLVAWELRSESLGGLWRYMIGSEDGDIALRFSGMLEQEPAASFNGRALYAAFTQWFRDDERINACDHETLDYLDSIMPDLQARRNGGYKKLGPVGIEILSCLPDKTAYLQGYGREILRDPFYAGMDDEINQSHLLQILHDIRVTQVQGVPFRDAHLAARIFPGGVFTPEGPVFPPHRF
ncbi:MAG: hypothetical protein IT559_00115 [Alphaproteobacteria bacterium]|nr:hypothetical protein [Alphaproteobacteria bacterium]